MNIYEFAEKILLGTDIEDKLFESEIDTKYLARKNTTLPSVPGRNNQIKFNNIQVKFPKGKSVQNPDKMAQALNFFANHELMAIEMMAAAILYYPTQNQDDFNFKLGLIPTIKDEQKHLKLYRKRMNELGSDFGDFPLNDFFWKQMSSLKTPSQFYALMALTFEAANLDFASHYQKLFFEIGDEKTSNIMKVIYEDEIKHVARGTVWLNKWREDKDLWTYYQENLPSLMTPARSKGMIVDIEARRKAGLSDSFINNIINYRDEFKVTDRKDWK